MRNTMVTIPGGIKMMYVLPSAFLESLRFSKAKIFILKTGKKSDSFLGLKHVLSSRTPLLCQSLGNRSLLFSPF